MTGAMEEAAELAARAAVRDMARMLFDAGLLKGSPDDRALVWMKQAERLKAERDELQSRLARVRVRHRKMTLTGKCRVGRKTWPCDTIGDLDA